MTERIRERLRDLAAFLELAHAVESIDETLEHLQSAVAASMVQSRATAQQCLLLLFQRTSEPPSLLAFLDESAHTDDDMRKREIAHAREKVLELLATFLKLYSAHAAVTANPVVALVTRCQLIARVDASNKVRAAAFSVIINVLKYSARRLASPDIEPAQYVEKLFSDLKFVKLTQTTKGLAIETIGHLAERFATDVAPLAPQLLDWTEGALDKQFTTAEPEMLVVRGLLFLLGRLLAFEPARYQAQPAKRQKIYSYLNIVFASSVNGQLSRFLVTKAALQFLALHCALFRDDIGANSATWFAYMKFCCTKENKTLKEHAFVCSSGVMTIVGDVLADTTATESTMNVNKKAFTRILKELLPELNNADASSYLLGFVLQCLGKLAACIHRFLGASGFAKIDEKLKSYGENLLALDERTTAMKWSIVSQYLECIGQFVRQNDTAPLSDGYMNFLGDLLCHVVAAYPRCVWKTKHYVYKSVLHIFDAVARRAVLKRLADRFVYHTLLLTISNLTEADAGITLYHPDTGNVETRLLFDYEALWVGLVCVTGPTSQFDASIKHELLDSLVKCILRVIAHLDLTYTYESETSSSTQGFGGYKPRVARDHTIMLNLTEFFCRLGPRFTPAALASWVPLLLQHTLQYSKRLPLVSSFYHIGTVLGRVAESLALFEPAADHTTDASDARESTHHAAINDVNVGLYDEYTLFLTTVCAQLRFYKDELLVAAAEFVLLAPLPLIELDNVLPALLSTLDIGKSYLPAAEIGVAALERWLQARPAQLDAALPTILPLLAPYLSRSDDDESTSTSSSSEQAPSVSTDVALKATAAAASTSEEEGVTELSKLQRRILVVLGSTGGKGATLLSKLRVSASTSAPSTSDNDMIGKHSVPQFTLALELSDTSITLALDKLLAQTGDLAVASTDRRIKISACETYHALVCYLCGKIATHPHSSERKSVFYPALQGAFPTLLVLATDPEKVARTLFEPLLFQVIRWLCSASEMYPFEFAMVLDELVAGLSQARNSAVREVAGKALAAVLSASIEHASNASRGVAKAHVVFERLFALCRHPSSVQRIGAATAINYVVRALNQDNSEIISAFALRCVKAFLHSLRLCDRDDAHDRHGGMAIARQSIERAITKLERAVARFPHVFVKKAAHRSVTSTDETLDETVEWLFAHAMAREQSFRETCQSVFVSFAPLVSGVGCKKWLLEYAAQGADVAGLLAPIDALARVMQVSGRVSAVMHDTSDTNDEVVAWLEQFAASAEAYTWCMDLLGDRASGVLSTPAMPGAASRGIVAKRKGGDASDSAELQQQFTMAWAIKQFLNLTYPGDVERSTGTRAYVQHKRLLEAYGASLASLCRLAAPAFASSSAASFAWLLDTADRDVCESFATRIVHIVADDQLTHWGVNCTHVASIRAFCSAIVASGSAFADQLRSAATERLGPLLRPLDVVANPPASSSDDLAAIHCASAFLTQLVECKILDQRTAGHFQQEFADAALRSIQTDASPAQRDHVALAALKTALLCGWDIARAFQDADARKHFAPIYHDIVACLPQPAIWQASATYLVGTAADDAHVLSVLADVLLTVASLQLFRVESPEWDTFTELLLPKAKRFVQSIRIGDLELQHQRMALQVLLHLITIYDSCSKSLRDVLRIGPVPDIRDVVVEVLSHRDTSYLVKADALTALARLSRCSSSGGGSATAMSSDTSSAQVLVTALKTFIAEEFPIVSTDVQRGTKEFDVYRLLFHHLLLVVEESRSIVFLQVLYSTLLEGSQHLFAHDVTRALAGFAEKLASTAALRITDRNSSSSSEASELLELADVLLDATIDAGVRKTLLVSVFTPMMELESADAMKQFFLTETASPGAMTMLSKFATLIANAADLSTTGSFFSAAVAFALVEMLFRLADPELIRSDINAAFLGHASGKGREFTMLVCKSASKLITKTHSGGANTATIRFACSEAYSCLLTAVSKTQKQEKFFDQILFQEALWPNVIDVAQKFELRAETGAFPTIPLSTLSASTLRAHQHAQDAASRTPRTARARTSATSSSTLQFFTGSSLSQTASPLLVSGDGATTQSAAEQRLATNSAVYKNLTIELDAINDHPSMVPLLRTLVLMKDEFGANWDAATMPSWMHKLYSVVADPLTELNIRLFIVKVVLNVPDPFTPYATTWLAKLLDAVLEATMASTPPEFNYLLRDCCNLALGEWRDVSVAALRGSPSRFISTLIEFTPHTSNAILHDNILLVTRLIVHWNRAVTVSATTVERFLFSDNQEARLEVAERIAALQILSAMLTAGTLDELDAETPSVTGRSVVDGIVLALQHKRAMVYTVAAEVAGLCLQTFRTKRSTFARAVADEIVKAYNNEDSGRFLALLRNVSFHAAHCIDAMMLQRLCAVLPKVIAVDTWARLASESLEHAAKHADVAPLLFPSIQPVLSRLISHRDAAVQFATLRTLDSITSTLEPATLERLLASSSDGGMDLLGHYATHTDTNCRTLMYMMAKRFFRSDVLPATLKDALRRALLGGLCDSDTSIRDALLKFWHECELLPSASSLRLLELFDSLFTPALADKWVFYATNLLVLLSHSANDYDAPLFASALTKSEFRDAVVDAKWEGQTQTMAPMFSVESDAFAAKLARMRDADSAGTLSFLGSLSSDPFDTAHQSQLVTATFDASQQSRTLGTQTGTRPRRRFARQQYAKPSSTATAASLNRRSTSDFFREQYTLLHKHQQAITTRHRRARNQHVAIKRQYRIGEYPDIQIKTRDIVEPLMLLCANHAATSSVVFASFFASIVLGAGFQHNVELSDKLVDRMQQTLAQPSVSPSLVRCLHLAYFNTIITNPNVMRDLALSATSIGSSTLASGSYHSGELIIEELLIHHMESTNNSDNGLDVVASYEAATEYHDQLYKVLATVQKSDLLIALAASCCTIDPTKIALRARISGDLPLAIASYQSAERLLATDKDTSDDVAMLDIESQSMLPTTSSSLAKQFEAQRCYWERLACLEQLNNWDKLERELLPNDISNSSNTGSINSTSSSSTNSGMHVVWQQEPPYLEQGLGHCVRSFVGVLERVRDDPRALEKRRRKIRALVDAAASEPHVSELLASTFCPELCLMYLELGDTSRVRVLVETFYSKFVARWQSTSAAAPLPRLDLMQALASVVQIDELLVLVQPQPTRASKSSSSDTLERKYVAFSDRWTRHAHPSDGVESVRAWSRYYMTQSVASAFVCTHGVNTGVLSDAAMRTLQVDAAQVMLQFGKVAVTNDMLALASKYLKDFREVCNRQQLPKVSALMIDVFVTHVLKLADRHLHKQHQQTSGDSSSSSAIESVTAVTRYYQAAARMFDNDDILTVFETADARERVAIGALEARAFGSAAQFYLTDGNDASAAEECFTRSIDVFERSCKTVTALSHTTNDGATLAAFRTCRLTFVQFLVDLLFANDGRNTNRSSSNKSPWEAFTDRETLTKLLLENVLEGMAMGDQECSNYLPQLCDAIAPFPALVQQFEREMLASVPMWTCLRWAAQLMALLNGPISDTIARVLEKMASEYPAALFYDFKVTCAGSMKGFRTDVTRLAALLANPVMEKFVDALRLVHHPELRLKEGLREIARCLGESKAARATELMDALWTDCFALERTLLGNHIGRYNREWAKKTRPHMEKLLGKHGRNLTAKSVAAAREWITNNFAVVPGRHGITKDMKARLVDFAEWLDEFDHTKSRLELPGQYGTYWGKPDPSRHVHVLSVASLLGVLASKQLPKQMTLHCSDERDYTFLVKGGEDLRLDQRIEQLFDVMNQILAADPRCRDRNLVTRTYKVVPMTHEIGILEWLHDTTTLKSLLEQRLQTDARCADLAANKRQKLQLFNTTAARTYESFLLKQRGTSLCAKVAALSTADVAANLHKVQQLVPADLLRRQLLDTSASFETFLSVRSAFATSLAVFSACSYILGIGDRHLDNFLLDLRTGAVVGIDFGVSFGAGASALPVPELMPFRVTRQLATVVTPFDSATVLAQDMQAVFGALRARKQVIESVMDVFLHEPLLDWQHATMTYQREIFAAGGEATEAATGSNNSSSSTGSSTPVHAKDNGDNDAMLDDADVDAAPTKRVKRTTGRESSKATGSSNTTTTSTVTTLFESSDAMDASASPAEKGNSSTSAWLPDVKIAIARRKLEGFSPRVLLKEELSQNPYLRGAALTTFHALVDGIDDGHHDSSKESKSALLSPLAQSEELLALATSPDILGRTYYGWMPWL